MKRYSFVVVLSTIALAQPGPTVTISQQYSFAPVGLAAGQTLRLNVANLSTGTTSCMGNLSFVSSDGVSIKNEDVTIGPGKTMSYPLSDTEVAANVAEIRGVVRINRQVGGVVLTPGAPISPGCSAIMSLELVDATGTRAVLTNPTLVSGLVPILTTPPPQ
jgi:hypothetical protein